MEWGTGWINGMVRWYDYDNGMVRHGTIITTKEIIGNGTMVRLRQQYGAAWYDYNYKRDNWHGMVGCI